jgi:negative regulator of sigma E activity
MTLRAPLIPALALILLAPAKSPPPETGMSLLHAAVDASRHVSFTGQVELLEIGAHGAEASIFRVEHRSPDLTRRWYISPRNLYGDSIVSHGNDVYAIDVLHHRVVVTHNETFGIHYGWTHDVALLTKNYRPVMDHDETVAGHLVDVISLVNRYSGKTTMKLWIDEVTNLTLRREVYAPDGSVLLSMHFDNVKFTNSIPLSTFALPDGYTITAGPSRGAPSDDPSAVMTRSGFHPHGPHYLPEGFTAVAGDLADEHGVHILHLLYSDGLRTVSLFENANGAAVDMSGYHPVNIDVSGIPMQSVEQGATMLLAWSDSGIHYALVGDLGITELERIATSISH